MKHKLAVTIGGMLLLTLVAYLGYFAGRVHAAIRWSWVPKEQTLVSVAMERIEVLLSKGDTGAVVRAVGAYNQVIRSKTNDFDYYRAADALWENMKEKP